jgi:glycosyltransferase involved in cell wall biosynthesis
MKEPLISVIIPAYNSENTIGTALRSIVDQTYRNLEIIVVDDFSTDGTADIIKAFSKEDPRVIYLRSTFDDPNRVNRHGRNINAGWSARNAGLERARGEYITFQDADDASFLNRIEVQYNLLKKHNATHVTLDWQRFDEKLLGKSFDMSDYSNPTTVRPTELYTLARKTKGVAYSLLGPLASKISFEAKHARILNRLFFRSLESYPGTGNSPLFKREVIEKVRFRKLADRVWPSFVGRGADRDFNFQVAETFRNSYVFFIPMYMWRQDKENARYKSGGAKLITN